MNPFDMLEKLINERGSAVVLRERLQLAGDHHDALQRELSAAKVERDALQAQVQALRAEVDEVRRLKEDSDRQREQDRARADEVPGDAAAVLRAVAAGPKRSADDLADLVKLSRETVALHLGLLARLGHVAVHDPAALDPWSNLPPVYSATTDGLALLRDRGMI